MKKLFFVLIFVFLCYPPSLFADDVIVDSDGNLYTGFGASGNLEVSGGSGEDAISGTASGTGAAGVYGTNRESGNYGFLGDDSVGVYGYSIGGYAGYFEGNARVTGNLTVEGLFTAPNAGYITGVNAGAGLSGGGTSGDITVDVDFAGTGSADTVSRSDHDHSSQYYDMGHVDALETRIAALETVCNAGDFLYCYTGSSGTMDVGLCKAGTRGCNSEGTGFGDCTGEVIPVTEICDGLDNDCDGSIDEGCDADGDGFTYVAGDCDDSDPDIRPDAVDLPDNDHVDSNCDGIDGDINRSYFVSTAGQDTNPGTQAAPFRTIQHAIGEAFADGMKEHVLVSSGVYSEVLVLPDGVSIFGQYDPASWERSAGNITEISSSVSVGLTVSSYASTGYIEGFTITASDSSGGDSSRGVVLNDVSGTLYVRYNSISSGNGWNGMDGFDGGTGTSTSGSIGQDGCDGCSSYGYGGSGGSSTCGATGGKGGRGGYISAGETGMDGSSGGGMGGQGGQYSGDSCGFLGWDGGAGADGFDGFDGSNGTRPSDQEKGVLTGYDWVALNGYGGQDGIAGSGGGGGGGGGGNYNMPPLCLADRSGGGGGGGSGGCGGSGGAGGNGGSGSIGILAINADGAVVSNNTISTASGGNGGDGGNGGTGGIGGTGGPGGNGLDEGRDGGIGGNGGSGGSGGSGAGGAGGMSAGILRSSSSGLITSTNTFFLGTSGLGGTGGSGAENGMNGIQAQDYSLN